MAITSKLNKFAQVKSLSDRDLPIDPKLGVLNYYDATSTASQTVITLPFSVEVANKTAFDLHIDGKIQREGGSFHYTFTSIVDGFSNEITLTSSISAGLYIIARRLGYTKESLLTANLQKTSIKFTLDGAIPLFSVIDGIHRVNSPKILNHVSLAMINSGASGSTTVTINRDGTSGSATRTASLTANGGVASTYVTLTSLQVVAGDVLWVDVTGLPTTGAPEELTVELYFD